MDSMQYLLSTRSKLTRVIGMAFGILGTSCTPTLRRATFGITTGVVMRGTTPSWELHCGSGTASCAVDAVICFALLRPTQGTPAKQTSTPLAQWPDSARVTM